MKYAHHMILTGYFLGLLTNASDLTMVALLVLDVVRFLEGGGFPIFPGSLHGIFFSCGLAIFLLYRFFASVPTSWVPSFAHIWSASKAAYRRIWSTVNKAWAYVLGIGREV